VRGALRSALVACTGELAALHSAGYGIPADRHIEVQRTAKDAAGELMPYGLLTFVDERGMWPVRGTCTGDWSRRPGGSPVDDWDARSDQRVFSDCSTRAGRFA
jgi:hypothetical protein